YITAVHVLEHLDDESLAKAVAEIRRVLRPSGFVFVRCFTERDMRSDKRKGSDIFYRFYDLDSIKDAFSDFQIVSAEVKEDTTRFGTTRSRVEALLKL
ncbi:MAG: methyltransferase domain-containing protein, partial [Candidatus Methanomethylophilaceae archaeon]|nr:methyltransferase domain-containing protein [Candidatus Methanomethylophilaceae archaeon]